MRKGWRPGQRAFTLLEVLFVVAIIGIIAVMGMLLVGPMLKRQRLTSTSNDLKIVAQSVRTSGQNANAMSFLRVAPPNPDGTIPVQVFVDSNGNFGLDVGTDRLVREYLVPADLTLTSPDPDGAGPATTWDQWVAVAANDHYIACDFLGRTVNPVTGIQANRPLTLELTHSDMISGTLTPRITWTLTINPVWNVALAQRLGP